MKLNLLHGYTASIHYITDTEGHIPSFDHSVVNSRVVKLDKHQRLVFRSSAQCPYFVYGGDLTDRGSGDIELTERLLDFKYRYSGQVILLTGNRESSKTRLHTELNPKHIRERLIRGGVPHWLQSKPHVLPSDYVKKHMIARGQSFKHQDQIAEYVNGLKLEDCQLIYLKWMLEQNLGCLHTFSYHAQYLASRSGCNPCDVSDYEVLDNLLEHTAPHGLMGEYLKQTQIAAIIPDTGILVVHGGLTPANTGRIPGMGLADSPIPDAESWIKQFNDWYRLEVRKWANSDPAELPLQLLPARSPLTTFSTQIPAEYKSIVTASMLDDQRQFIAIPEEVCDYLIRNGIYLVLTGHQPCGDHPAILRARNDRVVFINGDTGYANSPAKEAHDTRGMASHTLQIFANKQNAGIEIDACLLDNEFIHTQLEITRGKLDHKHYVGKLLDRNELVQCQLKDGNYRSIQQCGFAVKYAILSPEEVKARLLSE